jgi:hypothetical protein
MVLMGRRTALTPTLVVPDEQTWTVAGADPAAAGLRPVFALGAAQRLLVPERLPESLVDALGARAGELPPGVAVDQRPLDGSAGEPVARVVGRDGSGLGAPALGREVHGDMHVSHDAHADHDPHAGHDTHGDHRDMHAGHDMHDDHGEMMAIVGEPSADGLVMEPIEFRFGPLGTPLPGGLAVDVTLDGDVVAKSTVHALLRSPAVVDGDAGPPDMLAPVAWRVAIERAAGVATSEADRWLQVAAVEVERAVSHLAWLRAFGRLLGWQRLVDRCSEALSALAPQPVLAVDVLESARKPVQAVVALVDGSRWLRLRTGGVAAIAAEAAGEKQLRGPVARASGLAADSRSQDPLYGQLGFTVAVRSGGDALARTRLRADETAAALELAVGAARSATAWTPANATPDENGATVEGPRGPVRARRLPESWQLSAPGAAEAVEVAGESMRGLEWAAALVALASFDLSPWRVSE